MNSFTKILCIQCKVYYGSEERNGMCSVCFKDFKNKEQLFKAEEPEQKVIETSTSVKIESSPVTSTPVTEDVKMEDTASISTRPVQTNPYACWVCNLRVGYTGFKCKCEYIFCGAHRHFSAHNCDFDYKSYDREKLIKKGNHFGETTMSSK